jgi:hypothetical protein
MPNALGAHHFVSGLDLCPLSGRKEDSFRIIVSIVVSIVVNNDRGEERDKDGWPNMRHAVNPSEHSGRYSARYSR